MNQLWRQARSRRMTPAYAWVVLLGIGCGICLASAHTVAGPSSLHLRMLLVKEPATAQKIAALLAQGEAFAWLASEYSIDPTKTQGGFLGLVVLAELQESLRALVENLEVGEYTGPVRMPAGFAFFQRTTMAHYTAALRLMQTDTYREALVFLDKDLALNPDRVHSLEIKGYALEQLRQIPEAKAVYREIIRQEPGNVLAHNNLGAILDQEGQYTEAAKLLERAKALDPSQHVTLYNLAWLYTTGLPQLPKALEYIQQAIAWKPDAAHYYALLGDIYAKQGQRQQASRALAKAAEIDPENARYQERLTALEKPAHTLPPTKTATEPPPASSSSKTATAAIKLVIHPGGEQSDQLVTRLLQGHGFPVALHITNPKPLHGMRIYHKPQALESARSIRDLINPELQLKRLTWKSKFDIIVYVGQ